MVNGKHAEDRSEELDNGAVQQHECRNKPDGQRENGQAIFKAHGARWVYDKTPDRAFHRPGPPDEKAKLFPFYFRFTNSELRLIQCICSHLAGFYINAARSPTRDEARRTEVNYCEVRLDANNLSRDMRVYLAPRRLIARDFEQVAKRGLLDPATADNNRRRGSAGY